MYKFIVVRIVLKCSIEHNKTVAFYKNKTKGSKWQFQKKIDFG